jgi:hypothetical protein
VAIQRQEDEEAPEEENPFESPEARRAREDAQKTQGDPNEGTAPFQPPGTVPFQRPAPEEEDPFDRESPKVYPEYQPKAPEPDPDFEPEPEEPGPETGTQGAGPGNESGSGGAGSGNDGTPDNDDIPGSHDFSPAVGPLAEPERASEGEGGEGEQNQDNVENQGEEEEEDPEEDEKDPNHRSTVDPDKRGKSKQGTKNALKPHNLPQPGEEDDTDRPDTGVPGQRRDKSEAPQDPWDREDDIDKAMKRRVQGGRRKLRDEE